MACEEETPANELVNLNKRQDARESFCLVLPAFTEQTLQFGSKARREGAGADFFLGAGATTHGAVALSRSTFLLG